MTVVAVALVAALMAGGWSASAETASECFDTPTRQGCEGMFETVIVVTNHVDASAAAVLSKARGIPVAVLPEVRTMWEGATDCAIGVGRHADDLASWYGHGSNSAEVFQGADRYATTQELARAAWDSSWVPCG